MSLYPQSASKRSNAASSSASGSRNLSPYRDIETSNSSVSDNLSGSPVHISREPSPLAGLPDPNEFAITPETPNRNNGNLSKSRETGGGVGSGPRGPAVTYGEDEDDDLQGWEDTFSDRDMPSDTRPPARAGEGKSHTPLLSKDKPQDYSNSPRPLLPRRSTSRFHERDPIESASKATRKRYTYAGFFLLLSLISFTVQTETAVYIQHYLGWRKPYCMLYLTHGSWSLLWPTQLLIIRLQKWKMPWSTFWRRHMQILHSTAQMVEHRTLHVPSSLSHRSPVPYFLRTTAFVTCALTVAGGSWYVAVDLTTPSDLTAIYNCSAFFAYAFAVPLLGEKLRWSKVAAVAVAIAGVLVVAYGDAAPPKHGSKSGGGTTPGNSPGRGRDEASNRALGNLVIGVGSVLYGFYEVLYKKVACPPDGCSPGRGMIFANTFGSMIGSFTLAVLWLPLPVLHYLGWETFELPKGEAAWMLVISVLANATFSGSFLILISLTSPVLSSVAALLTIFLVAVADQLMPPPLYNPLSGAAIGGGLLIIVAFVVLSWATYREMDEERRAKAARDEVEESDVEDA